MRFANSCYPSGETNRNNAPWKIDHWKRRFLLDTTIFRCFVRFREGNAFLGVWTPTAFLGVSTSRNITKCPTSPGSSDAAHTRLLLHQCSNVWIESCFAKLCKHLAASYTTTKVCNHYQSPQKMIQEKQSFRASLDHFLADPSPLKQRCNQQAANHRRSFALPRPAMRSPGKGLFRSDARPGLQASRTSWRFWWVWEKGRNLETQQSATFRLAWWHAEAQIYETSIIKVRSLCWKKYLSKFSSKNLPIVLAVKCCSSCLPKAFHILQAHGHWVHERISSLMHRRQNCAVLLSKSCSRQCIIGAS